MQSQNGRVISVCFQGKLFNITVTEVYAPTTAAEEAEVEWFYDDLQDLRTNTKNISPFDHRGLEYRSRITGKFGLGV